MSEKYRAQREQHFLHFLKDNNIKLTPLEKYINGNTKIDFQCEHGHVFPIRPRAIIDGQGCPYCSGNKVLVGFNDFNTTHPELSHYLLNKNNGNNYSFGSRKKVNWICPDCGEIIKKSFYDVSKYGLSCPVCSDGISFSEKFLISFFKQLNVDYFHDKYLPWSKNKRYDFYLSKYNIIVECHGMQHYEKTFLNDSLLEVQKNDSSKIELAFANGVDKYIVLDCRYSELEYIKNSIINSELANIFNIENIDWCKCSLDAQRNIIYEIVDLWEQGNNAPEIAKIMGIDRHTSLKYLKQANEIGLCKYDPILETQKGRNKARNNLKRPIICIETQKVYESISDAARELKCAYQGIQRCCVGKAQTYKGSHWEYLYS